MKVIKYVLPFLVLLPFYVLAQDPTPTATPTPPVEPVTVEEAIGLLAALISLFKNGKILLGFAVLLNIIVFVIKNYAHWLKIPSEWKVPIITGLGLVVTILARLITGAEWSIEWVFAFLSGPLAIFIHQLVSRFKNGEEPTG